MAPVGEGLYRRGYAGDTFNTVWHMAQLLGDAARAGFVTRVGRDGLSDAFVAEMAADGLDVSGVIRDPERGMGLYLIELDGVERSFHYWRDTLGRATAGRRSGRPRRGRARGRPDPPVGDHPRHSLGRRAGDRCSGCSPRRDARVPSSPLIRTSGHASGPRTARSRRQSRACSRSPTSRFRASTTRPPTGRMRRPRTRSTGSSRFGVREVVVKNGAGSVHVHAEGSILEVATPPVEEVRDTTGAGDAFNAGYLSARLLGCGSAEAVAAGQRLSAEVIRNPGARAPKEWVRAQKRRLTHEGGPYGRSGSMQAGL